MKPTSIKPSLIQHEVLCYNCRGTGYTPPHHTLGKLIAMMDEEDGPNFKINFIKLIRSQWGMGLREAKEVAEAALNFRLAVIEATKPQAERFLNIGNETVQSIAERKRLTKLTYDEANPDLSDKDLLNGAMYVEEK